MQELFDEILAVIRKYHIDTVYCVNDSLYTLETVEELQKSVLRKYLRSCLGRKRSVALYGDGKFCNSIFDTISENLNIICIIDNYKTQKKTDNNIPIVCMDEFLSNYERQTEAVIVTSWNYHEAFCEELMLIGYGGGIIDIPEYLKEKFPYFHRPIYEYAQPLGYLQINELELLYHEKAGLEKYIVLKRLIYELCRIKDFLYAEKYIYDIGMFFEEYGEENNYRSAIKEIKEILERCVRQKGENVLFIHIIDSLADYIIDKMPWLKSYAEEGVRFRGITVQYPCTSYSMNTMFTGKRPFEIESSSENISWEDSELLRFIKEKYSLDFVSVDNHVTQQFKEINHSHNEKSSYFALTEILFEGLSLWKKKKKNNVIVINSGWELHTSFYRIGAAQKLILCDEMTKKEQFEIQFSEAIQYVDEQLEWYNNFYQLTDMPMIIMGDHGVSTEEVYNYFLGGKADFTRGNIKELTAALIIRGIEKHGEIMGLISNAKIPSIIMAVLNKETDSFEDMCEEVIELEFIPGWDERYCRRFMPRRIFGQYEGFIGVRTKDEIYLVSASDKELYFRLDIAKGYRNCINDSHYKLQIEQCRNRLMNKKFPIRFFLEKKYKKHLELLEIYDSECYQIINEKMWMENHGEKG